MKLLVEIDDEIPEDAQELIHHSVNHMAGVKSVKLLTEELPPEGPENEDWKYNMGQLLFWTVVFGMVLCVIVLVDETLVPFLRGTLCQSG